MSQSTLDRRTERTKESLLDALMELTLLHGYDKVSVQKIVDHANVGRTTFYAHFDDKDALLSFALGRIEAAMHDSVEFELFLNGIILHAVENPSIFRAFFVAHTLRERVTRVFATLLEQHLQLTHSKDVAERHAQFMAGGIVALLIWWQTKQPHLDASDILATINRQLGQVG